MTQKWEYTTVATSTRFLTEDRLLRVFDSYGAEGWELCGFLPADGDPGGYLAFFKRPVKEPK